MNIEQIKKKKINAVIAVIYMNIVILTQIFFAITKINLESSIIYFIITSILIIISLINNKKYIDLKFNIFIISIVFIISINYFFQNYNNIFLNQIIYIIQFVMLPIYFSKNINDVNIFLEYWYRISLGIFFMFICYINEIVRNMGYMSIGIYFQLCFIAILVNYYKKRNTIDLIILIAIYIYSFIYGGRGSILGMTLSVLYIIYLNMDIKKGSFYIISIIPIYFFVRENLGYIINTIKIVLEKNNIYSYSINKFLIGLQDGIVASSSGRDILIDEAITLILNNNFMPKGIGYYTYITGNPYPHNLILEGLILFGIFFIPIIILLFIKFMKRYKKINNVYIKLLLILLILTSITRLMLSSSILMDISLWYFIGLTYFNKNLSIQT